jgi:hypothetical protein
VVGGELVVVVAARTEGDAPLHPGSVVVVGPSASVQFAGTHGFKFRVIHVDSRPTYDGWAWLDGYQLNNRGQAVARRKIFVKPSGLVRVSA